MQRLFNSEVQQGLLVFAPFFLVTSSFYMIAKIGLLVVLLFLLQVVLVFSIRHLLSVNLKTPAILIIGVVVVLMTRILLDAEAYTIAETVRVFLPLMIINSLVLSISEEVLSIPNFNSLLGKLVNTAIVILFFFLLFGFFKAMLVDVAFFTSPAGCLLLVGSLFALINFFKSFYQQESS